MRAGVIPYVFQVGIRGMVKLITVHGTFAGDEADEGEKWWQRGSPFLTELQGYIAEPLEVEPFHWSGENSEMDRRQASNQLAKEISKSESPPFLIGHSHGGSIGSLCLLGMFLKKGSESAKAVRGFVSIGMPLLTFKPNANIFSRFNVVGRLLLLLAMLLLIDAFRQADWTGTYFDPTPALTQSVTPQIFVTTLTIVKSLVSLAGAVAFSSLIVLYLFNRRSAKRGHLLRNGGLRSIFGDRVSTLFHPQDEAVFGLRNMVGIKPKLVRFQNIFIGVFSFVAFALVAIEVAALMGRSAITDSAFYAEDGGPKMYAYPRSRTSGVLPAIQFQNTPDRRDMYWYLLAPSYRLRSSLVSIPAEEVFSQPDIVEALQVLEGRQRSALMKKSFEQVRGTFLVPIGFEDEFYQGLVISLSGFPAWLQRDRERTTDRLLAPVRENGIVVGHEFEQVPVPGVFDSLAADSPPPDPEWAIYHFLYAASPSFFGDFPPGSNSNDPLLPPFIYVRADYSELIPALSSTGTIYNSSLLRGSVAFYYAMSDQIRVGKPFGQIDASLSLENLFSPELAYVGGHAPQFRLLYELPEIDAFESLVTSVGELAGFYDWFEQNVPVLLPVIESLFIAFLAGLAGAVILTPVLQAFIRTTLLKTAFGNDTYGEKVIALDHDPILPDSSGLIPTSVAEDMTKNSLADAARTTQIFRDLVISAPTRIGAKDSTGGVELDGSELMHNAYFHSSLFIKYLAAQMIEKFGLTPSEKFKTDKEAMAFKYTV